MESDIIEISLEEEGRRKEEDLVICLQGAEEITDLFWKGERTSKEMKYPYDELY